MTKIALDLPDGVRAVPMVVVVYVDAECRLQSSMIVDDRHVPAADSIALIEKTIDKSKNGG